MKGHSLVRQHKKMLETNTRQEKNYFTVVKHPYYCYDHPAAPCSGMAQVTEYQLGHWALALGAKFDTDECGDDKCRKCDTPCYLIDSDSHTGVRCTQIMRLEQ